MTSRPSAHVTFRRHLASRVSARHGRYRSDTQWSSGWSICWWNSLVQDLDQILLSDCPHKAIYHAHTCRVCQWVCTCAWLIIHVHVWMHVLLRMCMCVHVCVVDCASARASVLVYGSICVGCARVLIHGVMSDCISGCGRGGDVGDIMTVPVHSLTDKTHRLTRGLPEHIKQAIGPHKREMTWRRWVTAPQWATGALAQGGVYYWSREN